MKNDFNRVAPFYDALAKRVFGRHLLQSQKVLLDQVPQASKLLILGGGSGQMLSYVPGQCSLTYVEKSPKMMDRAKSRSHELSIEYIQEDFLKWPCQDCFDYILCPFFLDCFQLGSLRKVLVKCKQLLHANGRLLVADFEQQGRFRLLLKGMHLFFRWVAHLESDTLQAIHGETLEAGFLLESENFFYDGLIFSRSYAPIT